MRLLRYCFATLLLVISTASVADAQAWEAVREGKAVVIMRHASAPGVGDPGHFRLGDCTTQRNLNAQGREQAQRWGRFFHEQGLGSARVYTSRWCRAVDTAQGFGLPQVRQLPALDSFFQKRDQGPAQMQALRDFLNGLPAGEAVIMVSHQVNITALTGEFPASGEAIVLALPLTTPATVLARVAVPER